MTAGPVVVDYRCPRCRGMLEEPPEGYRCPGCDRLYPVVRGIPDFRLAPDPYLDLEADRAKGRLLADVTGLDFRGLLEEYWRLTRDTPAAMAHRFVAHDLEGEERGRALLAELAAELPELAAPGLAPEVGVLELGCRSGGVVAAAARRGHPAVGIDVAFRWLVIARRRLEEAGLGVQLCCCNAEHLPFAEGAVGVVLAESVLEHTAEPAAVVAEAHRALQPGGAFLATTWNRLALAPEPHVRLWGVGFLPRAAARRYVRWRRGVPYDRVWLRSAGELRRLAGASPFRGGTLAPAALTPGQLRAVPPPLRPVAALYRRLRGSPLLRLPLLLFGPVLRLLCRREPSPGVAPTL